MGPPILPFTLRAITQGQLLGAPHDACYIKAISAPRFGINTTIISNTNPLTVRKAGEITDGLISSARPERNPSPRGQWRLC